MNNLRTIVFISCIGLAAIPGFGQRSVIPGYLGKRTTFEINGNVMASLSGYNINNRITFINMLFEADENRYSLLAVNTRWEAAASYVIGRRVSVQAEYAIGQTGFEAGAIDILGGNFPGEQGTGFYRLSYSHIGVGLLMYTRSNWGIAPLGSYWSIKALMINGRAELSQVRRSDEYVAISKCNCIANNNINNADANTFGLQLGLGSKRGFAKRFFYHGGFTTTATPRLFNPDFGSEPFLVKESMLDRLLENYIFYVHFGVGMLLF
jgi:hypothetical protein